MFWNTSRLSQSDRNNWTARFNIPPCEACNYFSFRLFVFSSDGSPKGILQNVIRRSRNPPENFGRFGCDITAVRSRGSFFRLKTTVNLRNSRRAEAFRHGRSWTEEKEETASYSMYPRYVISHGTIWRSEKYLGSYGALDTATSKFTRISRGALGKAEGISKLQQFVSRREPARTLGTFPLNFSRSNRRTSLEQNLIFAFERTVSAKIPPIMVWRICGRG